MTGTDQIKKERYPVYPGEYRPPEMNFRKILQEIRRKEDAHPLINRSECEDYIKIEITAPGHKREDFIIRAFKDRVVVMAIKNKEETKTDPYLQQEFDFSCFSHCINLPPHADTDFARAEYKTGILHLYFPKESRPVQNSIHRIAVY